MTVTDTPKPTTDELAAIDRYQETIAGIPDCLEFPEHDFAGVEGVPGDPTGATSWGYLHDWYVALDTLMSDFEIYYSEQTGSLFAWAYLNREARAFLIAYRATLGAVASIHCPGYFDPVQAPLGTQIHLSCGFVPGEDDHRGIWGLGDWLDKEEGR